MAMSINTVDISGALASAQAQQQKALTANTTDGADVVSDAEKAKLKAKSKEFESFYLYQVLELMQPKTDEDSVFNGGVGEEMFRHNLNEQMGKNLTNAGGIGLSDVVYKELLKHQEALVSAQTQAAAYSAKPN